MIKRVIISYQGSVHARAHAEYVKTLLEQIGVNVKMMHLEPTKFHSGRGRTVRRLDTKGTSL